MSDFGGLSSNGLLWILTNEGWSGGVGGSGDYGSDCTVTYILNRVGFGPGLTDSVAGIIGTSITLGTKFTGEQVTNFFIKLCQHYSSQLAKDGITASQYGQNVYDLMYYLHHWLPVGYKNTARGLKNGKTIKDIFSDRNYIIYPDKNRSWFGQAMAETKGNEKNAWQLINDFIGIGMGTTPENPGQRYNAYMGQGASQKLLDYVNKITGGAPLGVFNGTGSGTGATVNGSVYGSSYGIRKIQEGLPNTVYQLETYGERNNVLLQSNARKKEFKSMVDEMVKQVPNRERDILVSTEMYNSSILKTTQRSKQERKVRR
ncbi:MAG: hypothetical protein NC548_24665 [Lachnospiraceae bacterium]|nr:hypothetical protein [Lachnospiraceae bacterium]